MHTSTPVIHNMLSVVEGWEQTQDRRAIFLTCYSMMTGSMLTALENGEFEDSPWVMELLNHFAGYYFTALNAYDSAAHDTPSVWHYTFEAARTPSLHVLQNLLLGVNAHICYDLVFVLVDMLKDWESLDAAQRAARYRDHCHVNEIIYRTINKVQDEVVARYSFSMAVLDVLMGTLDELLLKHMITRWREEVWQSATDILACQSDSQRAEVCLSVETRSLNRATMIAGTRGLQWHAA